MSAFTNNIVNITNENIAIIDNLKIYSLAKPLLLFYIIIASQYTGNLLGKQMKEFIESNRLVQHIIGFLMLATLINLTIKVEDIKKSLIYSLIGYIWFILTTKLDIHWNIITILLLLLIYLYESKLFEHELTILKDTVLNTEEKDNTIKNNNNYRIKLIIITLIITMIGSLLYQQKKSIQYGGEFSIKKYFLY